MTDTTPDTNSDKLEHSPLGQQALDNTWGARIRRWAAALPPGLTEAQAKHHRLLMRITSILVVCGLIYTWLYATFHAPRIAVCVALATIVVAFDLWLERHTPDTRLCGSILAGALWMAVTAATFLSGGVLSAPSNWFLVLPVAATFINGSRAGLVWAFLSLGAVGGLYFLHEWGFPFPQDVHPDYRALEQTVIDASALVSITALAILYELHRREAGGAIQESEGRYRGLVVQAHDMIQQVSLEGNYLYVNPAWLNTLGYQQADVGSLTIRDVVHPDHFEKCALLIREAPEGDSTPFQTEMVFLTKDKREIPVEGSISFNETEDGRFRCTQGIFRDVRERKAADRLKQEFVSTVSHELRTPLTSIQGSLGLALGGAAGALPAELRDLLAIAHSNCDRLVRLVNDILDVEKLEAGKMEFKMMPLQAGGRLEAAVAAIQGFASAHGVGVEIEGGGCPAYIQADSDRFDQVLTNLLSNAIKFSHAGQMVTARVEAEAGKVRISVSDRGPGIPEEFRGRIFGKFVQADSSDRRSGQGTGLGLNIVKAIVERMGGHVGFESEVGKGTTFYVELPQYVDGVATASERAPVRRILVCEDDPQVASFLANLLWEEGFEVQIAPDTKSALQMASSGTFDAMTTDVDLPDGDGISLMRRLRERAGSRNLPVVVVSGGTPGRGKAGDPSLLLVDWVEKPIRQGELLDAVRRACRPSRNEKPRILYVEDDPSARTLAGKLLQDDATVVGVATLAEAKQALATSQYDLLLLDVLLPDGHGLDLVGYLRDHGHARLPIVVFSAYEPHSEDLRLVTRSLVKSRVSPQELVQTIRDLIRTA